MARQSFVQRRSAGVRMPIAHVGRLRTGTGFLLRQHGQDIAEMALILPVFLLLLLGIIEFGIILFTYNTVASTAREGARYGVIAGRTIEQIRHYATDHALGLNDEDVCTAIRGGR